MKGFYGYLLIAFSIGLSQTAVAEVSAGGGIAAIYIEEVVTNNTLTSGATVMPIYSVVNVGKQLHPNLRLQFSAHHHWYIDANSNIYLSGLTGGGLAILLPNMLDTSLHVTGGLANKNIFGTGDSAYGWGMNLALSHSLYRKFDALLSYSYLSLNGVASTYSNGDAQSISSLQLGVLYRW